MQLGGEWHAVVADDLGRRSFPDPALDDSGWEPVAVPGHWRSAPAFGATEGPVFLRRRFDAPVAQAGRRAWLRFDGIFSQGDVWLDGSYLGDTEGYFVPHTFEVTAAMAARPEHLLAVEVTCPPAGDPRAGRALTGAFQDRSWVDPAWNPGGIWAPVTVSETGPVRITDVWVRCPDARPEHATVEVDVELDAAVATSVPLAVVVRDDRGDEVARREDEEAVAVGANRVRRRLRVEQPRLWWPHALGAQALHEVEVVVGDGAGSESDRALRPTGLRQVRMRGLVASVNGERLQLKGACYGPTRRELAEAPANRIAGDVGLAVGAGLDLLRVTSHVGRPELYDAADRAGLLLWQDLPLGGGRSDVRRQAARQARAMVALLGHHPSVAIWCGHDDALPDPGAGPVRRAVGQARPDWGRAALDRSVRRAIERADGSRPVLARSDGLPHPAGAGPSHLWYGWSDGPVGELATVLRRVPVLGRFVAELGAQAVPPTDGWIDASRWPELDWDGLAEHHCAQPEVLRAVVPPALHPGYDDWAAATRAHQAEVVRRSVETLRRLKYRPNGGFALFALADAQPALGWSLLDHTRAPKPAWDALAAACAPVAVVADLPAPAYRPGARLSLAVHVVNDLRAPVEPVEVRAEVTWPGGGWSGGWGGGVGADAVARVGRIDLDLPTAPGPVTVDLRLAHPGGGATNRYTTSVGLPPAADPTIGPTTEDQWPRP